MCEGFNFFTSSPILVIGGQKYVKASTFMGINGLGKTLPDDVHLIFLSTQHGEGRCVKITEMIGSLAGVSTVGKQTRPD